MKRFAFAFERLLRVKQQRERLAEMALARARAELDAAQARVVALRLQLDEIAHGLTGSVGRTVAPAEWGATYERSAHLGREIEAAERQVALAEERLAEAARQRTALAVEVEALQTLRAQEWERHRQEARRAEQQRLDELSLSRWRPGDPNRETTDR